jgi:hypothetical protein
MFRRIPFLCLSVALFISIIYFASCDDSGTNPSGGGFSFKLTVVDRDGAPLPGLNLSRRCSIEYDAPAIASAHAGKQLQAFADALPAASFTSSAPAADPPTEFFLYPSNPNPGIFFASIKLDVPLSCDVTVRVMNWRGREKVSHSLSVFGPGWVILSYPFVDGGSVDQPNGIYSCEYVATEPVDSTILFKDSVYFSGYTDKDPYRLSMGETNSKGYFSTSDKGYFPSLQGRQPQMGISDTGEETGMFSFSDTVEITIRSEPPPGVSGYIYWMTREVEISGGSNEFEWVFVPDDSIAVVTE